MASVDGHGHLLSLKVMRVSRPGLANAWEPFYSSSSSFSARSTASILSLQGKTPLPGHPKTLRDLTHVSEFLTLPVAFGAIQLGETFSSCLCVNNEANTDVEGVSVRVEMQTANAKVVLAEVGGPDGKTVAAGDALEIIVHHEVKELGQHVLACTVNYHLPSGFRHAPGPAEGSSDSSLQGFRKFYKFVVTNPLSVKTKVNIPRSPSALLDPLEREKVFLEIHIQNTTQEPMWFARIYFECAEGWTAIDMNQLSGATPDEKTHIFSGSMALLQPHAVRQYIYVLSPTTIPIFPVLLQPGSIIQLGRLDISWRTQFGEPGRLLTSMLSRRIPGPPPPSVIQQPPSAIPPYLQRGGTPSSTPRAQSAQLPPSRPTSPSPASHRPGSPFRNRPTPTPRPQSPAGSISNIPAPAARPLAVSDQSSDIEVDLIVTRSAPKLVHVGEPFKMEFKLTASAAIPKGTRHQSISIVVQHLRFPRVPAVSDSPAATMVSSHRESHVSPVKSAQATQRPSTDRTLVASPSTTNVNSEGNGLLSLPPPYFETIDQTRDMKLKGCDFLGPSAIVLEPIQLDVPLESGNVHLTRMEGSQQFELTFLPLRTGYVCVGGLRILLVGHELTDVERSVHRMVKAPRTLKEHDVIGEIWVRS
ncbi:hypothetical protein V8B97DRAFT_2016708 [Scleroderma yunnanense]